MKRSFAGFIYKNQTGETQSPEWELLKGELDEDEDALSVLDEERINSKYDYIVSAFEFDGDIPDDVMDHLYLAESSADENEFFDLLDNSKVLSKLKDLANEIV